MTLLMLFFTGDANVPFVQDTAFIGDVKRTHTFGLSLFSCWVIT